MIHRALQQLQTFFRLTRREELLWVLAPLLALAGQVYTVFLPHNLTRAAFQLEMHNQVLHGTAQAYYQYQMYLHDLLLESVFQYYPARHAWDFSFLYCIYYLAGLTLFFAVLFRLCRRFASTAAVTVAMVYLAAIFPLMWYDNHYHPGDPWGAAISVLLMEWLIADRRGGRFYLGLLAAGFIWEKTLLFPFSAALTDRQRGRRGWGVLLALGAGTGLAALGQLLPRLLYGTNRPIAGTTMPQNLAELPWFIFFMAIIYGVPIYYLLRYPREAPPALRMLAWQFPIWFGIYLLMNGVLKEMRGLLVMVPYTWPAFALCVDRMLPGRNQPLSDLPPAEQIGYNTAVEESR